MRLRSPTDSEAWKDERPGGLRDALKLARRGRPGPPGENDSPALLTFPGRKRKQIPGQLSLDDETRGDAA